MPRTALFLMHNFNDIDHMTPVIDYLEKTGEWACEVVFYPFATLGSVDYESDWRLAYLRETHGVRVRHVREVDPFARVTEAVLWLRNALTTLCDKTPAMGRLLGRDPRGLLPWFLLWRYYDHLLTLWCTRLSPLGARLMREVAPDVVAIDWGESHLFIYPVLWQAYRLGVRVLQLPHGAWTYEGVYSHASQFDEEKLRKALKRRTPTTRSEVMAVDNLYKALRSRMQLVDPDSIRILGLPRFTRAWQSVLATVPRGTAPIEATGRPRLVWFTTWLMATDVARVERTVALLESYGDRLDIVLKVHSRNPAYDKQGYAALLSPRSPLRLVGNEIDSFAMSRWADIVLITQSSIVYDAFVMGKPVFYLKYTHDFECMWEVDGAGETVRDEAQLETLLQAVAERRYTPSYSPEELERYVRIGLHGGVPEADVLPSYRQMFDQAAARRRVTVGLSIEQAEALWRKEGRAEAAVPVFETA